MSEEFPFQKAHDAIVSMLHDYLAEKENAERLASENAILMRKTSDLMDEVERLKMEQKLKAVPVEAKLFDRVAELQAQVERLTKAGDKLHAFLINYIVEGRISSAYLNKLDDGWNAAKEGKQP